MRRRRLVRLAAAAAGLLAAPAGCQPAVSGPPTVRFGQEACARCRMIISDDRFAAALTTEEGESAKFDDVGCMVEHEAGGFRPASAYWVRAYRTDAWLDARTAVFVQSKSITSPMGFGVAALSEPPAAGEFADGPDPRVTRFEGLPELINSESGGGSPHAEP